MHPLIAIPATGALVYRAWSKKSLTPAGILTAAFTAIAHAFHPWNLPFVLLAVFFLAGTRVTHVKEDVKKQLTLHSKGTSDKEGPRTHIQVLANSLMASVFTIMHAIQLRSRRRAYLDPNIPNAEGSVCYSWGGDVLLVGIVANYAAVCADTFSSELGILAKGQPRLITSLTLRKVPPGTNGGVTILGLGAGLLGSAIIVSATMLFLPVCGPQTSAFLGGGKPWTLGERRIFMAFMVLWGAFGSVLDSFLGGMFQRSVRDVRSGKIVEGDGGSRALVSTGPGEAKKGSDGKAAVEGEAKKTGEKTDSTAAATGTDGGDKYNPADKHRKSTYGDERPSRVVESGWDLLDNNDVNFMMAAMMSVGAMAIASWYWGVPFQDVMKI